MQFINNRYAQTITRDIYDLTMVCAYLERRHPQLNATSRVCWINRPEITLVNEIRWELPIGLTHKRPGRKAQLRRLFGKLLRNTALYNRGMTYPPPTFDKNRYRTLRLTPTSLPCNRGYINFGEAYDAITDSLFLMRY